MVIIPKDKPVIENLNSYYVNMERLFEHYQGELGSGGFHLKSSLAEGAIFFDKDALLDGVLRDKNGERTGKEAVDLLMSGAAENNYAIGVYEIDPEKIYFWASIPAAKKIYKDLSTEFTDLEGLIKKMGAEKLTGFIEVSINGGQEGGVLFFHSGQSIGGSYTWENGGVDGSEENRTRLLKKTKEDGGIFHVSKISVRKKEKKPLTKPAPEEALEGNVLQSLEALLVRFEEMVTNGRKSRSEFSILLRKKFVEMADRFAFLDPFAGEFEYADRKISFFGEAGDRDLTEGVVTAVVELAEDLEMLPNIREEAAWALRKHGDGLRVKGINA